MNKIYHYWGAYYAALTAKFPPNEAAIIAWASQHVDDSHDFEEKRVILDKTGTHYTFKSISSENMGDAGLGTARDDTFRQVWCVYHFPPGNYLSYQSFRHSGKETLTEYNKDKGKIHQRPGHILRSFRGAGQQQMFGKLPSNVVPITEASFPSVAIEQDKLKREHFPLICRPNSDIAVEMVNDTVRRFNGQTSDNHYRYEDHGEFFKGNPESKNRGLYLIGLRMHVFSDTWAHQDFIGACDRVFNHREDLHYYEEGKWSGYAYSYGKKGDSKTKWISSQTAASSRRHSSFYLGHGSMGTLPDEPWQVYEWQPRWSRESLLRINPNIFMEAWVNFVNALICIRQGNVYTPVINPAPTCTVVGAKYEPPDSDPDLFKKKLQSWGVNNAEKILDALKKTFTPEAEAEKETIWNTNFQKIFPSQPPSYNEKKTNTEIKKYDSAGFFSTATFPLPKFITSDYFAFHHAAKTHYRFMMNTLVDQGFRVALTDYRTDAHRAALVNDYEVLNAARSGSNSPTVLISLAILDCLKKADLKIEEDIALQILFDDLKQCRLSKDACNRIDNELTTGAAFKHSDAVKQRLKQLKQELIKFLQSGAPRPPLVRSNAFRMPKRT